MPEQAGKQNERVYRAPVPFMGLFFGLLAVWTLATAPILIRRFQQGFFREDWLYWFMIGFFYVFTWFWSLGLFYRIAMGADGRIRMKSLRRSLELSAQQVNAIEGSRLSGGFGFIRFKLSRESAYLFCHRRDNEIDEIIREIRKINPLVKTLRI